MGRGPMTPPARACCPSCRLWVRVLCACPCGCGGRLCRACAHSLKGLIAVLQEVRP